MRLATLLITLVLALVSGCRYWSNTPGQAYKSKSVLQISLFSMSGRDQASVILRSRELRVTNDGGRTWRVIPSDAVADAFEGVTMLNDKRGWALNRQGHVLITDSGGATWTKISELHEYTCVSQIEFINEKEGWIRECLSLWRTEDGGVTWNKTLSTVTPGVLGQPTGMFPLDANILVVSGSGGQVYSTRDGGRTWRIDSPFGGENIDFGDVWFVDRMHGWLVGDQPGEPSRRPLLFETTDGGDSWKQVSLDADIAPSSVCFVGNEGWLAGSRRIVNGDSVRVEGVLLHTTDGIHWKRVELGPNEPFLSDVRFADKEHGWVIGEDSVLRTEDGGKTWKRVLSLPPQA